MADKVRENKASCVSLEQIRVYARELRHLYQAERQALQDLLAQLKALIAQAEAQTTGRKDPGLGLKRPPGKLTQINSGASPGPAEDLVGSGKELG